MRVADVLVERLVYWGLDTCFAVTGGGAMHLNDAFARNPRMDVHYLHHEQACAMAAEAYARVSGKPAVVNVTTGPGSINALGGVFGAYTDSVPMVVVSGQVRTDTMADHHDLGMLRQLGDQELRTTEVVQSITKRAWLLKNPEDTCTVVDAAYRLAVQGRPGPTWIDVPVDVQGTKFLGDASPSPTTSVSMTHMEMARKAEHVAKDLTAAMRPLIMVGTGVGLSASTDAVVRIAELTGTPVATAWSHDVFPNDHQLYAGRPGTIGTRAGNLIFQACDYLLVLGSRLNIRQLSYNFPAALPHAKIAWVDVDPHELVKPFLRPHLGVVADLRNFLPALEEALHTTPGVPEGREQRGNWRAACTAVRAAREPQWADYPVRDGYVNPYHLVMELSDLAKPGTVLVSGNAAACIVPFQVFVVPPDGRMFSNSGAASMGYDLPAALGASIADPKRPVVCLAGDGSIMMNLQELESIAHLPTDILVIILDNGGYLSIRQTQSNFFSHEAGCSPDSGLSFPDFEKVSRAFGLPTLVINGQPGWTEQLKEYMSHEFPRVIVAKVDPGQEFEPRLKSRTIDGQIVTPALDDMYPHLDPDVLESARRSLTDLNPV